VLPLLGVLGGIVLVDLALSGDNALVIGTAAASLPRRQRWLALFVGGAGAIALRLLFALLATFLLTLPLLQAAGAVLLLYIAVRLLMERGPGERSGEHSRDRSGKEGSTPAPRSFAGALFTILAADVSMSLDNVIAVGALAHGDLLLLATGILLSLIILLFGSALVAELTGRLPWLLDVAALTLGWTAAHMLLSDRQLSPFFQPYPWTGFLLPALCIGLVLLADLRLRLRSRHRSSRRTSAPTTSPREPLRPTTPGDPGELTPSSQPASGERSGD
jgi:YjbE family integral membrane protein